MDWFHLKELIVDATGLSRDALHILSGMLLHVAFAALSRRPLAYPFAWACVLAAAVANEAYDLAYEQWPDRSEQWAGGLHDLATTLAVPTMLLALARYCPGLIAGPRPPARPDDEA